MLDKHTMVQILVQMSGIEHIEMDMLFSELGFDSTNVIELLIELEIKYNLDLLDNNLNLDEFVRVSDVFDYINHLIEEKK